MEDEFADLAEATDAAAERRDRAQAVAKAAIEQMDRNLSAAESAAADWRAMRAGVGKQFKAMQADIAARRRAHVVRQAEQHAEAAKARAAWAASYAVAASKRAGGWGTARDSAFSSIPRHDRRRASTRPRRGRAVHEASVGAGLHPMMGTARIIMDPLPVLWTQSATTDR